MINWKSKTIPLDVPLPWPELKKFQLEKICYFFILQNRKFRETKRDEFSAHILNVKSSFLLRGCQNASHQDQIRSTRRWKRDKASQTCRAFNSSMIYRTRSWINFTGFPAFRISDQVFVYPELQLRYKTGKGRKIRHMKIMSNIFHKCQQMKFRLKAGIAKAGSQ